MAAAVADYRPAAVAEDKVKKSDNALTLALERTDDILAWVGAHKPAGLYLCGFSMETRDLIENSTAKLRKKNLDLIVANNPEGARRGLWRGHQRGDADLPRRRRGPAAAKQGRRGHAHRRRDRESEERVSVAGRVPAGGPRPAVAFAHRQ